MQATADAGGFFWFALMSEPLLLRMVDRRK